MFRIHFLDVGRGDSIIIQFGNGHTYLIDSNEISGKVAPCDYLKEIKVVELETVVATHLHTDHLLGLQRIIEGIPTRQVWLSEYNYIPNEAYENFLLALRNNPDIRIYFPRSGMKVIEGKDRLQVLAPPPNLLRGTHSDANNSSIVLKITITNEKKKTSTSAILGADAEMDCWAYILSEHRWNMKADLLKVSHHGSDYGTYKDVLAAINPKYAVVSVGTNPYGHPEQCALSFLAQKTTSQVFRTNRDGICVFESDGTGWECLRY